MRIKTKKPLPYKEKKNILVWSDAVTISTGFGIVSKNILAALHNTGRYNIDQVAINYYGDFFSMEKYPYQLVPAALLDKDDPYGCKLFLRSSAKKKYDAVFIINDTFITAMVSKALSELREKVYEKHGKTFKVVYYYPVDSDLSPELSTMIPTADRAVAYTNFASQETSRINLKSTDIIYHGVNTSVFFPIDRRERARFRKEALGLPEDAVLITNVNRNSPRKDVVKTLLAFKEFKKRIGKDCRLYLHMAPKDKTWHSGQETDLTIPCRQLGLELGKEILFPDKFDPARGVNEELLNLIYNSSDMFLTTTLGEGFGLSTLEAMACGIPLVCPNNTVFPELVGRNRGYMYPCKERIMIDASGLRPVGRIEDIVDTMVRCYRDSRKEEVISRALLFAEELDWKKITPRWVNLFDEETSSPWIRKENFGEGEVSSGEWI